MIRSLIPFRLMAVLFAVALVLNGCDSATDPADADGAPPTLAQTLNDEEMLAPDVLERTLLSDAPLADALASSELDAARFADRIVGAAFSITDDANGNAVVAFLRDEGGQLSPAGTYATGGTGSGGAIAGSTNPVLVTPSRSFLLAVNAGSDEVSVFRILKEARSLELVGSVPSGGPLPLSLTLSGDLLYVLNGGREGEPGNVSGFRLSPAGTLTPVTGGIRTLPEGVMAPPQLGFAPGGRALLVTDRPSNVLVAYNVRANGTLSGARVTPSAGVTPFGFDFDQYGRLFVSEANAPDGPVPDGSSLSSYERAGNGLAVLDGVVPTNETAACWTRVIGRYAYVTNTASNTVTGFRIGLDGSLTRLDEDGITAATGAAPHDMGVALRYLYVHNRNDGTVSAYRIRTNGSLSGIGTVGGLPGTAVGVAVF
ncbi:MAG: beta-propeller fold lactonase family protein [Bacteroidota bacterium]